MKKYYKILFIVILTFVGYTGAFAQNTLNVWLKSGIIAYYDFSEQPKITYTDADMVVTTPDIEVSYPIADLRKLTFVDNTGYTLADINADANINVADLTELVNLIMENYSENNQTFRSADINKDKSINVSDLTELVNLIMSTETPESKAYIANNILTLLKNQDGEIIHNAAIYNEQGELVQQLNVNSNSIIRYNVNHLPAGNYVVKADNMTLQLKKK